MRLRRSICLKSSATRERKKLGELNYSHRIRLPNKKSLKFKPWHSLMIRLKPRGGRGCHLSSENPPGNLFTKAAEEKSKSKGFPVLGNKLTDLSKLNRRRHIESHLRQEQCVSVVTIDHKKRYRIMLKPRHTQTRQKTKSIDPTFIQPTSMRCYAIGSTLRLPIPLFGK